jgi:hypothetical protein
MLLVFISFFGFFATFLAKFIKYNNGLFFTRTPQRYKDDRYRPEFERERNVGNLMADKLLRIAPVIIIISFLLIFIPALWLLGMSFLGFILLKLLKK